MSGYDGFHTVDDPREYMNAPAMLIASPHASSANGNAGGVVVAGNTAPGGGSAPKQSLPPILRAAVDATTGFDVLTADELQAYYAEQSVLRQRVADVSSRLEAELKMRDAANNLSRLHDDTASSINGSPGGRKKRFSRLLGSGDSAQSKQEKRLSRQAADEAQISAENITHLEQLRLDISQRLATVERHILQHHSGVMARALAGIPLPNHRRHQSGASVVSTGSGQRQSWVLPKTGPTSGHARQISTASAGAESNLARVEEYPRDNAELDALVSRVAAAVPAASPTPQGKVQFIQHAFDSVLRELSDARNASEAYQIQSQHGQERIAYLMRELSARETAASRELPSPQDAGHNAEVQQLRTELDAAVSAKNQLAKQLEQQRYELERSVQSLEDVTRLAVQHEGDRGEFEKLLNSLEAKIASLEDDKKTLLQQRLGTTQNTSLLCQEFQRIVGDLVLQHQEEVRSLYSRRLNVYDSREAGNPKLQQKTQTQVDVAPAKQRNSGDWGHPIASDLDSSPPEIPNYSSRRPTSSHSPTHSSYNISRSVTPPSPVKVHPSPARTTANSRSPGEYPGEGYSPGAWDSPQARFRKGHAPQPSQATISRATLEKEEERQKPETRDYEMRLPAPIDSSFDDSIQHSHDSLMRPNLQRANTEESDYSRTSSVYPDAPSASQSQASLRANPNIPGLHPNESAVSQASRRWDAAYNSGDDGLL